MGSSLDDALKRLETALGLLEASVSRRLDADRRRVDLETELQIMQDDRSRLAVELDGALVRLRQADAVVDDVSERVRRAIAAIEGVLVGGALDDADVEEDEEQVDEEADEEGDDEEEEEEEAEEEEEEEGDEEDEEEEDEGEEGEEEEYDEDEEDEEEEEGEEEEEEEEVPPRKRRR